MLQGSLISFLVLANVIIVAGLNIQSHTVTLTVKEEQTTETWPITNSGSFPQSYTLQAHDSDEIYKKFNITGSTLKLSHSFDFEDDSTGGRFEIKAVELSDPFSEWTLTVIVKIQDINDHTPELKNLPNAVDISEGVGVDSTIFTIEGEDDDGSETANNFNALTFSIVKGNIGNKFYIDVATQKTAFLKLGSRLDYDEGPAIYNLTINATDARAIKNPIGRWTVSYLIVNVTDVDDQSAVFTQNLYKVTLSESSQPGSNVIKVTAIDKDKGNDEVTYGMVQETNPGSMFEINGTTGNITLIGNLDRKTQSLYALLVSANSTYHDLMYAQVLITITDANVHSPNFTSQMYQGQVPENAEAGTLVLVIQAIDLDEGNNAQIGYSLEGNDSDGFYVETVNSFAYIFVNASLDYDLKRSYNFTIRATEISTAEKFDDTASIKLEITEVLANENHPKFNESSYSVNVTEGNTPGRIVQVGAIDDDQAHFASITYSIIDDYGMFVIDNLTGWINTTSVLDRESKDSYVLVIRATDGGAFPRYSDVLVFVTVIDSNDHSPTFQAGSYSGSVVESSNNGSIILAVQAVDLDKGTNAEFEFSIVGGDGKFSVFTNGDLGYITVNASLDYETHKNFTLSVIAKETSTYEKKESNVSVTISLVDVNDNAPVFSPVSGYTVDVAERNMNGASVLNVSASDKDSGLYGDVTYSLTTSQVPFSIDSNTGEISVDGTLDREIQDRFDLTIQAKDGGQPSLSSYVHVIVNVTDINDNVPEFSQTTYSVTINENTEIGSNILTVSAMDRDQSFNGYLTYYIEGGESLFKIDPNGVISVNGSLDYESSTSFSFRVIAQERSTSEKWKTNCTVIVNLNDVNEYDPEFTQVSYYTSIEENKLVGSEVITVNATDKDGYYNEISYTIVSGNNAGFFTMNHTSGVISTAASIDKETTDENFVLKIQVSDNGSPNRTSETFVVVEIFDTNDHSPIFARSSYNTTIPESLPIGTTLLTVKATDQDTNATHSALRYFVLNSDGKFDVHATTGQLFVNASLDYETKSTYTFTVIAEESNTVTKKRHNATIFITLTDTNEFDPVFTQGRFSANISENSESGSFVVQINATDQDGEYNQISYSISSSEGQNTFTVNTTTGLITTAAELDRETQDIFILTVQATDNGTPARKAAVTVIINIMDSNDHLPSFTQSSYTTTIPENLPAGTTVLTVEVMDDDIGANAEFKYQIIGGNDKFEISSYGVISTKAILNYEEKTSYTFVVIANETRSSLKSTYPNATVIVILRDVNEFNPVFSQVHYTANISENSTVGTFVIKVSATDHDGLYNQISYAIVGIVGGNNAELWINSTSGEIFTNTSLDRETKSQYILTVRAQDNGTEIARTAESTVVITVSDINDNGPKFLQSSYNVSIFENVAVDKTILSVEATDSDIGSNAVIGYSLIGSDGTFRIDTSGNIMVNESLDYETNLSYQFQVLASEIMTSPGFSDTTNVTIIIKDVNEFNPVFTLSRYAALINDSSSAGAQVVKVTASDGDGSHNIISYSIVHGDSGKFTVNSSTGWIETAEVLDSESADEYILTVRAKDNGDSPRTAEVLVIIAINKTMRNASFLLQDVYNITTLENVLQNTVLVKLDLRYSNNDMVSTFSFSIDGGDGDFDVTQQGEVIIARSLDYETKSSYTFTVIITEIQPASGLVANATINVKVEDVNEFNPQFDEEIYYANVSEGVTLRTHVTQVFANDSDKDFNVITYAIINGNQGNNFTVNSTTGVISTVTQLDRETQTQFVLTVRASDNGPSVRTAEVVVIVDILDISEHPPMFLMNNYTAIVYETAVVGTIVLLVTTRDQDMTSSSVTYSLVGADGKFGVTSKGVIYVNGSLDYETDQVIMFMIIAEEASPNSHLRHNATVVVKLRDVNEYDPVFNQTIYSASVKENDVPGTTVLTVSAADNDRDINVLIYKIVQGNEQKNFSINNKTGVITLAKPLDREVSHQMILTIRAEDNGEPARTAEVLVIIGIIDSNDLGPVFSKPQYNASVSEDAVIGTNVIAIQAVDLDAVADMLEYEIVNEDDFSVNTLFGLGFINVKNMLDYEMKQSYNFMIFAVEKSAEKRNSSVWINITVLDANDNRPMFVNDSYNGVVVEGESAGTTVLNVSAVDADSETFGPLSYHIVDGDHLGHFNIDNSTGRIYTSSILDRETQSEYSLIVEVRDNGSPPLTETITVTVKVLDNNDVNPQFIGIPYSALVAENSVENTTILTVQAVDIDKGENGEFTYSLIGANGLFTIKQQGDFGHILVTGDLDYEQNKTFTFYVVATESKTSEKLKTNATIVITVIDTNDNAPEFTQSLYEVSVGEASSFPVPVGTPISASDKDSGLFGEIMYYIIHGDENGNFTINNRTGQVETGAVLNREKKDKYVLTVQAIDGGSPPRKAVTTMVVVVTDKNEQAPYFVDTPYYSEIVENKEYTNFPVFKVMAKDPDQMTITYTMEASSTFSIESISGTITATGNFDREAQSMYNLSVTATDQGGRNISEHVVISVQDTNDNSPQFLETPYKTSIPDNTTIGLKIFDVKAIDMDEAHNAEIIFSLLGAEGKFSIDPKTGAISVSGKLDSQENSIYNLEVIATDRGIPQAMTNSTSVIINLTDYSNHPPEFENVAFVGEVLEGLENKFILKVEASDPDNGILGEITYGIIGGNTDNAFRINNTGAIISTKALDYENDTQKAFDLTVMVMDKAGLKDTTQVRITVVDTNDNVPRIVNLPTPAEFNISDNIPSGTLLYVLQGEDLDSGTNGDFEFYGASQPNNLTLGQTTGLIKAKTKLKSTSSSSILYNVFVKDIGNPSLASVNYTIKFNIISDGTFAPLTLPTLTEATVFENASINDIIVTVNSSLPADNFTILFQLPSDGYFKINSVGVISLSRALNRESQDGYSLLVMAIKDGKQAIGYVSIVVVDVNDEAPEFQFEVYKGQIDENIPQGSYVLEVKATDEDHQNMIVYDIISGNTGGVFNVSNSGKIQIAKTPDYETSAFYNLTVIATDGVNTGKTFVEISIMNKNDNSPKFVNSSYSVNLPENTSGGSSVIQVSAIDNDEDIVMYSISGGDGRFTIDSLTGVILTTDKHLDFEQTSSYTLNVTAKDIGGLKSSVLVLVNITDSNDNAPVFSQTSYNVSIKETYSGLLPLLLNATDSDAGNNGEVTYAIVDGPSSVKIDPVTGVLNVSMPLDRDADQTTKDEMCRGVFILTIRATDNGNPKLTDTAKVTILVTDINDNAPKFSKSTYEVLISVIDTGDVFRITADDPDCDVNKKIEYSFTSDNGSSLFMVNATTGNITIIKSLNGSQGVYYINVTASNYLVTPQLQTSVLVKITVIENKNYAPVFEKDQYSFNVSENAEVGAAVGSVSASDINQNKDGIFIYSIEMPSNPPFDIDPTNGAITLVRELDRELRTNYTLVVVAQDFGTPALRQTTNVHISVIDVNDVIPKFEQNEQRFNVPENITVGSLVCTISAAIDNDANEYGNPIYVIHSGNDAGHFRIDNSTGKIYLVKNLDREIINIFELTIYAYNHGSNIARKRRATEDNFDVLKVVIEVTDINDNYPEFALSNFVGVFKVTDPVGTNVTKIQATDEDEGSNSQIIYSIQSGNEAGAFIINPTTGQIITTANISQLGEQTKTVLTVVARDSADAPKQTQQPSTVTIYKLPDEVDPLELVVSSDLNEDKIKELLQNITGPGFDVVIQGITPNGLLSNVKYYVVKNGTFLTQEQMNLLITAYCAKNEEICKQWGLNLSAEGNTSALLGEDDITILEAMLITMGVIVGLGGIFGILLLCCLRRRKRYMPVYEPHDLIMPSKAVSFDERPHYYQPHGGSEANRESQEVEIHMDEEQTSVDSAEEVRAGSSSSIEAEKDAAIAKVQAYMNQALMNDDTGSDSDSSEDLDREQPTPAQVNGESTGSTERLVSTYTITNL